MGDHATNVPASIYLGDNNGGRNALKAICKKQSPQEKKFCVIKDLKIKVKSFFVAVFFWPFLCNNSHNRKGKSGIKV